MPRGDGTGPRGQGPGTGRRLGGRGFGQGGGRGRMGGRGLGADGYKMAKEEQRGELINIKINTENCTGCGICESMCPEVFKVKEDGKAYVINSEGCKGCNCNEVAQSCPSEAIIVEKIPA